MVIFLADFSFIQHFAIADDGDFGGIRDVAEKNVAALPASACGGVFQLRPLLDDIRDEKAPRNDDEVVHLVAVVVQKKEAGVIE